MYLRKFSEEYIALQAEIATGLHPTLQKKLAAHSSSEEEQIAALCAHCGIAVDGVFSEAGINALYARCAKILEDRRESTSGIIVVRQLDNLPTKGE